MYISTTDVCMSMIYTMLKSCSFRSFFLRCSVHFRFLPAWVGLPPRWWRGIVFYAAVFRQCVLWLVCVSGSYNGCYVNAGTRRGEYWMPQAPMFYPLKTSINVRTTQKQNVRSSCQRVHSRRVHLEHSCFSLQLLRTKPTPLKSFSRDLHGMMLSAARPSNTHKNHKRYNSATTCRSFANSFTAAVFCLKMFRFCFTVSGNCLFGFSHLSPISMSLQ